MENFILETALIITELWALVKKNEWKMDVKEIQDIEPSDNRNN